jgi:hypothetical protein
VSAVRFCPWPPVLQSPDWFPPVGALSFAASRFGVRLLSMKGVSATRDNLLAIVRDFTGFAARHRKCPGPPTLRSGFNTRQCQVQLMRLRQPVKVRNGSAWSNSGTEGIKAAIARNLQVSGECHRADHQHHEKREGYVQELFDWLYVVHR